MPDIAPPPLTANNALFLDFDGTLADLAERPELVSVPAGLPDLVGALLQRLRGAVAIISGRPLSEIDRLLNPLRLSGAGVHGTEFRLPGSLLVTQADMPAVARAEKQLRRIFSEDSRIVIENKRSAIALHYRQAPERMLECDVALRAALKDDPELVPVRGSMVIEAWPGSASKGKALQYLMSLAPFAGREPVALGDDTTDEDGFRMVSELGGYGIKIGPGDSHAHYRLPGVSAVHEWLAASLTKPGHAAA